MHALPRWESLPDLQLYMDQVLYVIENAVAPLLPAGEAAITPTMINNYVKQKLLPPTKKKKYDREHVARLILITLFKRVLSGVEIEAVLAALDEAHSPQQGYDAFCEALLCYLNGQNTDAAAPALFLAAVRALAGKLEFEALLPREETKEG